MRLLAGRNFFPDENNWQGGPRHIILNKEAALALGVDDYKNVIGKTMIDLDSDNKDELGEIVGVIDGYFQNSLDQEIKPTIFNCDQGGYFIFIRVRNVDMQDFVGKVKSEFQTLF